MTNSEKYKDAESRLKAYRKEQDANDCEISLGGFAAWLDKEDSGDILPCPFCGGDVEIHHVERGDFYYAVSKCGYTGKSENTRFDAILSHNKLVKDAVGGRRKTNLDKLLEVCRKTCPDNHGYEHKCGHCRTKELLDNLRKVEDDISEYKHIICGGW